MAGRRKKRKNLAGSAPMPYVCLLLYALLFLPITCIHKHALCIVYSTAAFFLYLPCLEEQPLCIRKEGRMPTMGHSSLLLGHLLQNLYKAAIKQWRAMPAFSMPPMLSKPSGRNGIMPMYMKKAGRGDAMLPCALLCCLPKEEEGAEESHCLFLLTAEKKEES